MRYNVSSQRQQPETADMWHICKRCKTDRSWLLIVCLVRIYHGISVIFSVMCKMLLSVGSKNTLRGYMFYSVYNTHDLNVVPRQKEHTRSFVESLWRLEQEVRVVWVTAFSSPVTFVYISTHSARERGKEGGR